MAKSPFFEVVSIDNMGNRPMLRFANEDPKIKITNVPLNMTNCIQWSMAVKMSLG